MKREENLALLKKIQIETGEMCELEDKTKEAEEKTTAKGQNVVMQWKEEDLDGDFDPEEHDKRMKQLFSDDFYDNADEEKPTWDDDDEIFEGMEGEEQDDAAEGADTEAADEGNWVQDEMGEWVQAEEGQENEGDSRSKRKKVHPSPLN